jgi:NADP-dependent 3-hydroxy acid dehydrogenase YdfG
VRNANSGSTRSKEQKMFVYRGSTALITGASKGLGKVFAQTLAARGMNLVLVARSGDALQALATDLAGRYGVKSIALDADLSEPNAATQIAEELVRRGVQVDLLINNAGLGLTGSFLSHDLRKKQSEILVNVHALAALSHVFGSGMAKRGSGGIINLASNASFQPIPFMATYAATKAFVLHFSEALQFELAGTGVHVMHAERERIMRHREHRVLPVDGLQHQFRRTAHGNVGTHLGILHVPRDVDHSRRRLRRKHRRLSAFCLITHLSLSSLVERSTSAWPMERPGTRRARHGL